MSFSHSSRDSVSTTSLMPKAEDTRTSTPLINFQTIVSSRESVDIYPQVKTDGGRKWIWLKTGVRNGILYLIYVAKSRSLVNNNEYLQLYTVTEESFFDCKPHGDKAILFKQLLNLYIFYLNHHQLKLQILKMRTIPSFSPPNAVYSLNTVGIYFEWSILPYKTKIFQGYCYKCGI